MKLGVIEIRQKKEKLHLSKHQVILYYSRNEKRDIGIDLDHNRSLVVWYL